MSRNRFAAIAVSVTVFVWCLSDGKNRSSASPPESQFEGPKWGGKYQEAADCTQCHAKPRQEDVDNRSLDFVLLTEYSIWKTHDKHAQAYAALLGERGQRMGKLLGMSVRDPKTGCMNCHAMSKLFGERPTRELDERPPDGVSCGGCHGPSRDWRDAHNNPTLPKEWRLQTPEWKASKGFRDLRDPETKATLCMSCHIGNAAQGKVVTHAMFAAGHPPLPPIEIATFTRNEPRHWRDSKEVPYFQNPSVEVKEIYHLHDVEFQQTKLALIGSVVALRETMQVAHDRANLQAESPAQLWPELLLGLDEKTAKDSGTLRKLASERWPEIALAHLDCYSCHHDLRDRSFRQDRGFGYRLSRDEFVRITPGRPPIRAWPTALLEAGIDYAGKKDELNALATALSEVADVCNARPCGEPRRVAKATQKVINWCNCMIAELNRTSYSPEKVRTLMINLSKLYGAAEKREATKKARPLLPDYESARQIVALLDIAYEELSARGAKDVTIAADLKRLADQVDLRPYTKRSKRLAVILKVVEKASGEKLRPEAMSEFTNYLSDIGNAHKLQGLIRNPFLVTIQSSLSNKSFTRELVEPKTVQELQVLSDEELKVVLQHVADYDPWIFKVNLKGLMGHLESKK